jgi:fibro-slime domain-containing protein
MMYRSIGDEGDMIRLGAVLLLVIIGFVGCADDDVAQGNSGTIDAGTQADMSDTPEPCEGPDAGPECNDQPVCGDGRKAPNEACDDGNTQAGDGCSADCRTVEDGWMCPLAGPCSLAAACGDASLDSGEACDDANTTPGDGCDASCTIEAGWLCPNPGESCTPAACGDGLRVGAEPCDDGNPNDGDGCSSTCEVETGWVCIETGCIAQQCGDGIRAGAEVCDDGNTDDGDGCASTCGLVEPNFVCPTPGQPCQSTVVCGDRRLGPGEACDDGNTTPGDGCDANCAIEPGWACAILGARCRAASCGDGIAVDDEQCDDMNTGNDDGCSDTCQVEQGWACPPMTACFETTCGDGNLEGTEQCDDGNLRPFDGCSETCTNEPSCSGGVCTAVCGDGVILPGPTQEACDDGNTNDGDGCSSTCTIEDGWACVIQPEPLPPTLTLPIVVRDFKGIEWYADNTTEYGHPDFNDPNDGNSTISFGIVEPTLGPNGRPVLAYSAAPTNDTTGLPKFAARFDEWFDSLSPWNIEELRSITLTLNQGTYSYSSSVTGFPGNSTNGFYPIDNGGWVAAGSEALRTSSSQVNDGADHNFNFTTETRFFFQYEGNEVLSFSGDDDLWVFIDGVLCLDVGGLHPAVSGQMNLADPTQETNATQRAIVQNCKAHLDSLVTANNPTPLVEMVIFHAERHTGASNFELELTGFVKQRSDCAEVCGDGIVTRSEVCDDGTNDGSYNGCSADCLNLGGFCGDATVNGPEICDLGAANNDGSYEGCNPDCTPAGTCGDGVVQPLEEVCDDGTNDGTYGSCSADCSAFADRCGDGVVNGPEECDQGLGANLGEYGGCNPDCSLAPFCGDGVQQGDEQCDDGNNDDLDGCLSNCERPIL